jgi:hypothetical protein
MMSPRMKARITLAILLIILLAFLLTSFGCRNGMSRPMHPDELNVDRPNTARIGEVSLS